MKYSIKEIAYFLFRRLPAIIVGKFIKKNLIHVHWGRGLKNFGDCLSPDILRYYGLTPVYVPNIMRADIVLAGTILQLIPNKYEGIIVGTGGDKQEYSFPKAQVLAVRGKLTQMRFSTEIRGTLKIGDPGLLMPYIYSQTVRKRYLLGIVVHFADKEADFLYSWKRNFGKNVLFIDVLRSPHFVIREIKQCEYIISSSLHGLIIADAYHIPNMRFVCSETMPTSNFTYNKFDDYYSSLNCESKYFRPTGNETIEELINITTLKPIESIALIQQELDKIMRQVASKFILN